MSFSSSSETQLAVIPEVDWGVTPATPAFQRIRSTGEGLSSGLESETSSEFSPIPDATDLIITGATADGDVNFELSFGDDFDIILSHSLRASWTEWGQLVGAAEQKSMTIEKRFATPSDDTPFKYFRYPGCRVNSLSIDVVESAKFEGTMEVMARSEETIDTAIIAGATYLEPNSNPVMSAPQIRNVKLGVIGSDCYVFKDISFNVDNGARSQTGFSTCFTGPFPDLEAKGIAYGRREITGSLTAYFSDETLYNAFKSNVYTWMMFDLSDGTNAYRVFIPRLKFSDGSTNASDNNSDIESALEWTATLSSDFNTAMILSGLENVTDDAIDVIRTLGTGAGFGRYFKTTEIINTKAVYVSYDGAYAIWNDATNWNVTTVADKDLEDATNSFQTIEDVEVGPVADTNWTPAGTFVGSDIRSQLFEPDAVITDATDFKVISNDV